MVDASPGSVASTQSWLLDQLAGESPLKLLDPEPPEPAGNHADPDEVVCAPELVVGTDGTDARGQPVPDLDDHPRRDEPATDVNSAAKRTALWMASGVVLLAVLIVLAFTAFGGGPDRPPPPRHTAVPAVVPAPTATTATVTARDQTVSYTPSTDSCPAGSTSPMALSDTSTDSAWVCSRGPQESLLDGQVLHVRFTCDRSRPDSACSYMLTSMSATPGWVAKTADGKDEWLAHRIVTRLQFNFFNGDTLAADPFFLNTNAVHGPVSAPLPGTVMASRVDVLILHTDRPPQAPPAVPDASVAGNGGPATGSEAEPAESIPGTEPGAADPAAGPTNDPADATFAMSQLQFFGHPPS